MTKDDYFIYANTQIRNANKRLQNAKEMLGEDQEFDINTIYDIGNIIHDCQICIELYVKAMFKLVEKDPPRKHGINFEDAEHFLRCDDFPEGFSGFSKLGRVIFLSKFWYEFYEYSKYGSMNLNYPPDQFLRIEDAERAIKDAKFCQDVAEDLVDAVKEERALESS